MHSYKFLNSQPYLTELIEQQQDQYIIDTLKIAKSCLVYSLDKRLSISGLNMRIEELGIYFVKSYEYNGNTNMSDNEYDDGSFKKIDSEYKNYIYYQDNAKGNIEKEYSPKKYDLSTPILKNEGKEALSNEVKGYKLDGSNSIEIGGVVYVNRKIEIVALKDNNFSQMKDSSDEFKELDNRKF